MIFVSDTVEKVKVNNRLHNKNETVSATIELGMISGDFMALLIYNHLHHMGMCINRFFYWKRINTAFFPLFLLFYYFYNLLYQLPCYFFFLENFFPYNSLIK